VRAENHKTEVCLPWGHLRLPPFPQIALRVLELANEDEVSVQALCELIATDPAFAGEVLTAANSILYAPRYPASSLMQAVSILGTKALQGMSITVAARAYMGKAMSQPAMRVLWLHNLASAIVAEDLAALGFVDKDVAYTAGILHDVGRVALAVVQPRDYAQLLETQRGPAAGILSQERALFGLDHCEAGLQLVSEWRLPEELEPAIFDHHAPRPPDSAWGLPELIKVSCRMADACGFLGFAGCEAEPYPQLLEQLPARERRLFPASVDALTAEIGARMQAIETL
jgi:putative nucleotidyltransferase with HDIG domain